MEVKQVFGLECGRSALTGVGFILRDGLDAAGEMGDDPTGGKSSKLLKLSCPTDGGETCSLTLLLLVARAVLELRRRNHVVPQTDPLTRPALRACRPGDGAPSCAKGRAAEGIEPTQRVGP